MTRIENGFRPSSFDTRFKVFILRNFNVFLFILYDHVKTAWCSGKSPNNHNFSHKKLTNCYLIVLSTVTSISKHSSLSMVYTEHDVRITSFILLITFHFRCFLFTIKKTTFLNVFAQITAYVL